MGQKLSYYKSCIIKGFSRKRYRLTCFLTALIRHVLPELAWQAFLRSQKRLQVLRLKNPEQAEEAAHCRCACGMAVGCGMFLERPSPAYVFSVCHLVAEAHRREGKRGSLSPEDSAQGWAGFPLRLSTGQIKLKWFYFNSTHCIGEDCCAHRFEASRSHGIFKKKDKIC